MASNKITDSFTDLTDKISPQQVNGVDHSAATVRATGSVTPQTLSDRFARTFYAKDFGAVGDGVHDDTTNLQACIDACIRASLTDGLVDGVLPARRSSIRMVLDKGIFKITAPLKIWSVIGFTLTGEGCNSRLYPVGLMPSVLDLNGVAFSTFGNFSIEGGAPGSSPSAELIDDLIYYYYDPATAGFSSSGNTFHDILVQNTRFKVGLRVGKPGLGVQVDVTEYRNLSIHGSRVSDTTADCYAHGVYVGDDVYGNVLAHHFYQLGATQCRVGLVNSRSHASVTGFSFSNNLTDFQGVGSDYFLLKSGRCEDSLKFLDCPGSGNLVNVAVESVLWTLGQAASPYRFATIEAGGAVRFANFTIPTYSGKSPTIYANGYSGLTVVLHAMHIGVPLDTFVAGLSDNSAARYVAEGYGYHALDGSLSTTPFSTNRIDGAPHFSGQPTFDAGGVFNGTVYTGPSSPIILGVGAYIGANNGSSLISADGTNATIGGAFSLYMPIRPNGFMQVTDHTSNPIVLYDEATKAATFYGEIGAPSWTLTDANDASSFKTRLLGGRNVPVIDADGGTNVVVLDQYGIAVNGSTRPALLGGAALTATPTDPSFPAGVFNGKINVRSAASDTIGAATSHFALSVSSPAADWYGWRIDGGGNSCYDFLGPAGTSAAANLLRFVWSTSTAVFAGPVTLSGVTTIRGDATAPSNANGSDGDWSFTADGHAYFKTGGVWVLKI